MLMLRALSLQLAAIADMLFASQRDIMRHDGCHA